MNMNPLQKTLLWLVFWAMIHPFCICIRMNITEHDSEIQPKNRCFSTMSKTLYIEKETHTPLWLWTSLIPLITSQYKELHHYWKWIWSFVVTSQYKELHKNHAIVKTHSHLDLVFLRYKQNFEEDDSDDTCCKIIMKYTIRILICIPVEIQAFAIFFFISIL